MYTISKGKTIITSGRVQMEPITPSYVKQCFIRTPILFIDKPIVHVTVYTSNGNNAFVVYGIEFSPNPNETIFKISATNNELGVESNDEYWCDFTMIGEKK